MLLSYSDQRIPYLSQNDHHVTCADYEAAAWLLPHRERYKQFRQAPLPVKVQEYCGCPITSPANACLLCHKGTSLENPEMVVPNMGGLNCLELEEYLSFITNVTRALPLL